MNNILYFAISAVLLWACYQFFYPTMESDEEKEKRTKKAVLLAIQESYDKDNEHLQELLSASLNWLRYNEEWLRTLTVDTYLTDEEKAKKMKETRQVIAFWHNASEALKGILKNRNWEL